MTKKNIFLLSIPIIGFILFLVIHFLFLRIINNAQQEYENLRVKQIISSDINYKIINIKSLFFQIPLMSNNVKILEFNIKRLQEELESTKFLLFILKNGGIYDKKVFLNLVNRDFFEKQYIFKKDQISIEYIDLVPKLDFLENKAKELENLLLTLYTAQREHNLFKLQRTRKKLVMFAMSLDSVFRRMIENSNRLFYETQLELIELERKVKDKITFYQNLEFGIILILIFIFIFVGYIIIKQLISLNRSLKRKLYIDELTQVFSREKLEEIKFGKNSILILLDIDGFSDINELYGMKKGNQVLQIVAQKLKEFNKNWMIFRVSADVFGLYLDDYHKMEVSIEEKLNQIKEHIMFQSIIIDDNIIDINITMGIAFGKNGLHNALVALHMSKKDNELYKIFHNDEEFKKEIEFNKTWQKEIKYALKEDRIEVFYQPIVDKNKQVFKYECLMRIKKIENGEIKYISPFFLDIAIKSKQYLAISRIMLKKVFASFKDGGLFSINLNYLDMSNDTTKKLLEELIIKYNAQNRVTFEILESESIQDYKVIEEFLQYFRKYGIKVSIDDFGSGYSNFKRILALNPDFIKFDGSLIKNINIDKKSYIIVKNMINYAKELNIKTIAEFVHSKEVFETCVSLGIDYFQGFYISKPLEKYESFK